ELAGLRENEVFLLAPVVQTFPVRINSDILFQLAQTRQPTYTLNGQTELAGVQTFNLAAEEYVIVYQLPNGTGGLTTYTLTFTVTTNGTVTVPAGERGLVAGGSGLGLPQPFLVPVRGDPPGRLCGPVRRPCRCPCVATLQRTEDESSCCRARVGTARHRPCVRPGEGRQGEGGG